MKTISGQAVSRFSFGCMQFGSKADQAASAAIYGAMREAGVNFFDTAHVYNEGRSEEILGELVAGDREDVFVATKFASGKSATAAVLEQEFSESRRRLGLDVVDLLYVHQNDEVTPLEQTLEALAPLVETGAVRHLGLSNYPAWKTMKARQIARGMGVDITFLQPMYNLVKRQVEVEILPMAESEGFYVCPYSPLGGGLLTGKYAQGVKGRLDESDMYARRYGVAWMHETAAKLAKLAEELGQSPATLAVAWAARHPGIWGPIISGHSVEQVQPSLAALEFEMDDALYDRLSGLSRKPAPANDRNEEG